MFEVSVSGSFEASHYIEVEGASPDYRRVHGHSFVVQAAVRAPGPSAEGWVLDLGLFETALKDVLAQLDHRVLNDVPGLERPTFEHILMWIEARLHEKGFTPSRIEIERPTVRQRAVYSPGT
jgi:6-pyruvoyltetrahydropterin/6-carboxytetrahydropterin synthase